MHLFRHLRTITHHRHLVIRGCFRAGIPWRGLMHDLSKYSPTELITGAKYYLGSRSPNAAEREANGYSIAWMHHKGRNPHHFEYWTDFSKATGRYEPVRMPIPYLKEMFCDRIAASKTYQGKRYTDRHPLDYLTSRGDRYLMHPESYALMKQMLTVLADKGEREAFRFVRQLRSYEDASRESRSDDRSKNADSGVGS